MGEKMQSSLLDTKVHVGVDPTGRLVGGEVQEKP